MARQRVSVHDREAIIRRAEDRCEYCKSPADFATQSFSIEHIKPVSRGGATISQNLAWACPGCNGHKYNKVEAPDPADGKIVPLFHPRKQAWSDHFRWNDDFTLVVGLTPEGRATISALKMNRPGVVNIRRALFVMGTHPPATLH